MFPLNLEYKNFNVHRRTSLSKTPQRKLIVAETSSSSKSSSSSNVSSQDNDLPSRKDLTAEIRNRRKASLTNSASKNGKTPAQQRIVNSSVNSRSVTKPSGGVCRAINFMQTLKENNSQLLTRSPVTGANVLRTGKPLSQVNDTAVSIIKQHHANHRASILRNSARLQNSLQNRRRLDGETRNSIDKEKNEKGASPSKLTSLLNSTNLLNDNGEKKLNGHSTNDLTSKSADRRTSLTSRASRHCETNNKTSNKDNQLNGSKTPIRQYPNVVSPSLIKPPTAQLIRHDPTANHSPVPSNQNVFNYSNLHNSKYYDDEDHCVSEASHKRANKRNQPVANDKIYTEQALSASCNRLNQVPTNSNNNLPSVTVVTASSTPSLNNGLNNATLLFPHSVMRNYEIGDLIGEGNFAVVHQCVHKRTRRRYALKVIDKRKCAGKEAMIENEVSILRKIKHPNIVQLHEDYDYANELYLVSREREIN